MTPGIKILFVILLFVAPFVLGALIANGLKLKAYASRISLILFTLSLGLSPFLWQIANGGSIQDEFRLGIDLAGGTNLVYQVDRDKAKAADKEISANAMDSLVTSINKRLNPSGTEQVTVRQVGADRVEVIIPGADPEVVAAQKRAMTRLGSLEFAIVAEPARHANIISRAEAETGNDIREEGKLIAGWRKVALKSDSKTEEKDVATQGLPSRVAKDGRTEVLLVFEDEKERVTGQYLKNAGFSRDQQGGPAVSFRFNDRGAKLFGDLTTKYRPIEGRPESHLAVLLDGFVHSAPAIREPITGGNGEITGSFTIDEVNELVGVLNAGALEIPLDQTPVSEFTISPLLGTDVQEKGKNALIWASIAVVVFMAIYYLVAGLIADLCLLLNLVLVLGTMAFINATFTLPGLAGLVLTIGMAVDANVLIFERIREERQKGSSLRMAIHNGFDRAFTTIVDANVTTLLTAVFLYLIGTDQIKGFAVTLFIGIVMSMFTALYAGRAIFEICEQKRWIKELKMAQLVKASNLNFISYQKICIGLSIALIVGGLVAFTSRGDENLDIDFTGGTMVSFEFAENAEPDGDASEFSADYIKNKLAETDLGSSLTVDKLTLQNAAGEILEGKYFRLRTKETDTEKVYQIVRDAFGDDLKKVTMEFTEPQPIEAGSAGIAGEEFVGGSRSTITFSSELSPAAAVDGLMLALSDIKSEGDEGTSKYEEPESLIAVQGTAGVGMDAAEGAVERFSAVELSVAPAIAAADFNTALNSMQQRMATSPTFEEVNSFGSAVASEMQQLAIVAILASLAAIVIYIWFRFQHLTFGLAAVVALVHDVFVVLGAVAIAALLSGGAIGEILQFDDFRINLPMIAAFLTVIGYSLNDTIVVFDRIREVRGKNPSITKDIINTSLNQTLSRTLLTSLTTFIVVVILYTWGGEGIHGFAFCLLVGIIAGTYSSIYIASPILLWLLNRKKAGATT
ncbi:MAG: protein translocase subunit SecD [Planctomycetaceae bacterium]|nr:protein translocase subunit SecD [Planctomycetaceae bacterium]